MTQEQLEAIEEKARVDIEIVRGVMSRVPPSWSIIEKMPAGRAFRRANIQVLFTVQKYEDRKIWLHCSACGRHNNGSFFLPDWEQFKRVKNDFIGEDRWAYQVFPSAKKYINHNPYVLHLFALLEGEPALPDFTWGLGTI
jgi:hypothetical protein